MAWAELGRSSEPDYVRREVNSVCDHRLKVVIVYCFCVIVSCFTKGISISISEFHLPTLPQGISWLPPHTECTSWYNLTTFHTQWLLWIYVHMHRTGRTWAHTFTLHRRHVYWYVRMYVNQQTLEQIMYVVYIQSYMHNTQSNLAHWL